MKYLVYGNDNERRQQEIEKLLAGFSKKGFSPLYFSDTNFSEVEFLSQALGTTLFGDKYVLVLTHCLSNPETKSFLESKKSEIEDTQIPIIFVESDFLKKDFPNFKKVFSEVIECKKKSAGEEGARFNVFPLIEAIASQDRKQSWLLLQQAQSAGVAPEEILNLLFWQYKTLALVATGESADTLGMKPFVHSKAKRVGAKYSPSELKQKLLTLIELFEESRFEGDGFERVERFVLR